MLTTRFLIPINLRISEFERPVLALLLSIRRYYPRLLSPVFKVRPECDKKWDSNHEDSHLRLSLDTPTGFCINCFSYDSKDSRYWSPYDFYEKGFDSQFMYDCPYGYTLSLSYSCNGIVRFQRCRAKSRGSFRKFLGTPTHSV